MSQPTGQDGRPVKTITLHSVQAEVFNCPARFTVWPAGRRSGKSEGAVLWTATKAQRARMQGKSGVIWVVYPTYKIASVAWRKFFKIVPHGWITDKAGTDLHPEAIRFGDVTVEFKSTVNAGNLVGEGLLAIWADECGEIPARAWSESIRPTLMDHQAPAMLTGTPKTIGWFQDQFRRGWEDGAVIRSFGLSTLQGHPTSINPFIPASEVELARAESSERVFRQEYLAEFLGDDGAVFRRVREARDNAKRALESLPEAERRPTWADSGGEWQGLNFSPRQTVALGVDLGKHQDWTVIVGMDSDGWVTYFDRFNQIDWVVQKERIRRAWEALDRPWIVMDATGLGDPIYDDLTWEGMSIEPFKFSGVSKVPLIERLAISFQQQTVKIPDVPVLINELVIFEYKKLPSGSVRYAAPDDKHDDCLPPGTLIKTAFGYVPVEDVKPGDLVVTHKGRLRRVEYHQVKQFSGQMWTMKFCSNVPVSLSYNHPLYRASRAYDGDVSGPWDRRGWTLPGDWKRTYRAVAGARRDLTCGEPGVLTEQSLGLSPNPAAKLREWTLDESAARFLGRFLADGHCHRRGIYVLDVAFHSDDQSIRWFEEYLGSMGVASHRDRKTGACVALTFSSRLLWTALRLAYDKNGEKAVPHWAASIDRGEMLDGWLDGDGWTHPRGHRIGATTSRSLALSMRDAALECGRYAAVRPVSRHRYGQDTKRQFRVEVRNARRKPTNTSIQDGEMFSLSRASSDHYEGIVHNLQVEEDRSFVAEGIVVHNCVMALALALRGAHKFQDSGVL